MSINCVIVPKNIYAVFTIPIVNALATLHKTINLLLVYTDILADKFFVLTIELYRIPVYTRIGLIVFS